MDWQYDVEYKSGRKEILKTSNAAKEKEIRKDLEKMQQGGGSRTFHRNNYRRGEAGTAQTRTPLSYRGYALGNTSRRKGKSPHILGGNRLAINNASRSLSG
ncbi:MAG: hypothetical protein DI551_07955 [Micavibrio aeruginosavorus]|uniref:Uncharacterized protein n=1 Tax=Micavibrio aeruginosavorus TaxID=349221 RepID=A0A2W5PRV4_9BACT|nr:MAG: hypothetical protein DI551_07955 [Micavibrio aeruginosavorus]